MQSGQVFEFYVNFGYVGLAIGMTLFGVVISIIDQNCKECLLQQNWSTFARWHLVGIAMILPTGQLFFLIASSAASAVLGWVLERLLMTSAFSGPNKLQRMATY